MHKLLHVAGFLQWWTWFKWIHGLRNLKL